MQIKREKEIDKNRERGREREILRKSCGKQNNKPRKRSEYFGESRGERVSRLLHTIYTPSKRTKKSHPKYFLNFSFKNLK